MASLNAALIASSNVVTGSTRRGKILSFVRDGIKINSANTDIATFAELPAKWRLRKLTPFNATGTPVLGTLALYTAAAAGGSALVAAGVLTALTDSSKALDMTVAVPDVQTSASVYLRNVAANVADLTVSVRLEVEDMT